MKQKAGRSICRALFVRIVVFLAVPFLIVSGFLVFRLVYTGIKNYRAGIEMAAEQGRAAREMHVQNVYAIANRICADDSLRGFLLVYYTNQNLHYYRAQMASIVSSENAQNYRYSIGIFYANESIPRGLGAFYYLSDLDQGAASGFLASDETERWVTPCEAEAYTGAFTPYARHYTYLRKAFLGRRLLYVLAVSVPEREMDAFLEVKPEFVRQFANTPEVIEQSGQYILNYDASRQLKGLPPEALEGALDAARRQGAIVQEVEVRGFPQKLVYIFPSNPQYGALAAIACLAVLFVAGLIWVVMRSVRQLSGSMYACLEKFDQSIESGFEEKLPVSGYEEIARMTRAFNKQIDKIQDLLALAADQAGLMKESRLKALQQQINPHFLYNTLEVFSYRMELYGHSEEADAMVAFSHMLRYSIVGREKFSSLKMELAQTDNYICIQRLKFPDVSFDIQIPQELYSLQLPRFLLQPLVENCFSHGYYGKPLHIVLNALDEGGYVCFEVADNGKGLTEPELRRINAALASRKDSDTLGIGLSNINARLCLFYSEKCRLYVSSQARKWTMVTWKIPKQEYRPCETDEESL